MTQRPSERSSMPQLSLAEFATLMALLTSLVALGIDAMLPALDVIGIDLAAEHANESQFIVTIFILGMGLGQLLFGPLSDAIGRKIPAYAGLVLFLIGCLVSIYAESMNGMLFGRFLQGLGVSGPRTITIAMVRDQFEGREMARIMSIIMGIFILVPAIAPSIGQLLMKVWNWPAIFGLLMVQALIAGTWFALRQPETLAVAKRRPFTFNVVLSGMRETLANRIARGYILAGGLIFASMVGYLSSAQRIFQDRFQTGDDFPLYFAILALAIGSASFTNAKFVMRFGMQRLVFIGLTGLIILSISYLLIWIIVPLGALPLWSFIVWGVGVFFCLGLLMGNMRTLAMQPLGHIAGVGTAVVGFFTTFISASLATLIGQSYNGTIAPLLIGFSVFGIGSLLMARWTEQGREETDSS